MRSPPAPLRRPPPEQLRLSHSRRSSCRVPPVPFRKTLLRLEHRLQDAAIGPATADIAAHPLAHPLGVVARLALVDQTDRAHDLARRAEAALKAVMRDEGGLHRMEHVALGEALDGDDLGAVEAQRESQTRIDPLPVQEHGASAALPAVAALLGSGQIEALAQEIEERHARVVERNLPPLTVDGKAHREGHEDSRAFGPAFVDIEAAGLLLGERRAASTAGFAIS